MIWSRGGCANLFCAAPSVALNALHAPRRHMLKDMLEIALHAFNRVQALIHLR